MNGNNGASKDPLEFGPPHLSVLAHFSPEAGEAVASVLIRELIDHVDRPLAASTNQKPKVEFKEESQLEWIMQVSFLDVFKNRVETT